jgi:hypothetical protein
MSAPKLTGKRAVIRCNSATLILLMMCLSVLVVCIPNTKATVNLSVVSHSNFYESDILYVVGEIQNNGNTPVKFPKIVGNFFDISGNSFYNASGNMYLDYLLPGRKCPFKILVFGSDARNAETYELIVSGSDTFIDKELGLELISNVTGIAENGNLQINGTIKNVGPSVATRVSLIVTFYDGSGKVVGVSYPDQSKPENIEASQIGVFNLVMVEEWSKNRFVSYSITAESSEYELSQSSISSTSPLPTNQLSPNSSQSTQPSSSPTPTPTSLVNSSTADYTLPTVILIVVIATLSVVLFALRRRKDEAKSAVFSPKTTSSITVPSKNQPNAVFISHVEEDAKIALDIADGLEKEGYQTWYYERDTLTGPSYLIQTKQAIENSQAVIVIISPNSLGSNQITKEVIRTHEACKPFVPVLNGISHSEFQARQPEWQEAIGAAASIPIPEQGVAAILPRIIGGLVSLGVRKKTGSEETDLKP